MSAALGSKGLLWVKLAEHRTGRVSPARLVARLLAAGLALYVLAWCVRIYVRKYYVWLPDYVRTATRPPETPIKPVHIFFLFADHFEPANHFDWTSLWEQRYPKLAGHHRDRSGRPLQHTWFYPGEQRFDENMTRLQHLVAAGYGEVELHLHHGNDSYESLRRKLEEGLAFFQKYGFSKTTDGVTRFAFIHGMSALGNSMGPADCGVDRELSLLRDLGCFADFTFPAPWLDAQPSMVNNIYEAIDGGGPKSYDRGAPVRVGSTPGGDLIIFQGPLQFAPAFNPWRLFTSLEDGAIQSGVPVTERRIDLWIRANVHVQGRPEWVFVKVWGHGAKPLEVNGVFGPDFDQALYYLENHYNDGVNYVLHYVTAREAFNLVRAAQRNRQGDPQQYLNFVVPPYVANSCAAPAGRHRRNGTVP